MLAIILMDLFWLAVIIGIVQFVRRRKKAKQDAQYCGSCRHVSPQEVCPGCGKTH